VVAGAFGGTSGCRGVTPAPQDQPARPHDRLDNISKQNGHQILFTDASMGIQKGEKVGLVGPNGPGKTTIFRMIAGEERPDDGQGVDRSRHDDRLFQPGCRRDRASAVAAVMDGVGPVSGLATEMPLEAAMVDPELADAKWAGTWMPSSLDMARCRRFEERMAMR
jgi:ATPase subunit of ABC transporter with duplicated ATPase domains